MFQDEFIKDLRLILFVSRFRMIGHLSSNFPSLKIDDFRKTKQILNDFDSVLKKVITFFRTEMFQDEFIKDLRLILFVGRFRMIGLLSSKFASL